MKICAGSPPGPGVEPNASGTTFPPSSKRATSPLVGDAITTVVDDRPPAIAPACVGAAGSISAASRPSTCVAATSSCSPTSTVPPSTTIDGIASHATFVSPGPAIAVETTYAPSSDSVRRDQSARTRVATPSGSTTATFPASSTTTCGAAVDGSVDGTVPGTDTVGSAAAGTVTSDGGGSGAAGAPDGADAEHAAVTSSPSTIQVRHIPLRHRAAVLRSAVNATGRTRPPRRAWRNPPPAGARRRPARAASRQRPARPPDSRRVR